MKTSSLLFSRSLILLILSTLSISVSAQENFDKFNRWVEDYVSLKSEGKANRSIRAGKELARARYKKMKELLLSDPALAISLAVPDNLRSQLPASIRPFIETQISDVADYEISFYDNIDPVTGELVESHIERTIIIDQKRYRAGIFGRRLDIASKENLSVHGIVLDDRIAVDESPVKLVSEFSAAGQTEIEVNVGGIIKRFRTFGDLKTFTQRLIAQEEMPVSDAGGDLLKGFSQAAAPFTTKGHKKVLYMRVDFSDLEGEPIEADKAEEVVNSECNRYYKTNSYDQTSLEATVTPLLRMPQTAQYYGENRATDQLMADARKAALEAGYNHDDFDFNIVAFNRVFSGWLGLAKGRRASYLNGSFGMKVTAHELGHNYGLMHASFWDTEDDSILGAGQRIEYGDPYDVMGAGDKHSHHFSGIYKARLGWIPISDVQTVSTSGTYQIYAHDVALAGTRVIRVYYSNNQFYNLDFRQTITDNPFVMGGLLVHRYLNARTELLDMSPGSIATAGNMRVRSPRDALDSPLEIGRTFSDLSTGIHITPIGKIGPDQEIMEVVINIGKFEGNRSPELMLDRAEVSVVVGQPVSFIATASDPDGDTLAYSWSSGLRSLGRNSAEGTFTWTREGDYEVRCTVTDMKGGVSVQKVMVKVQSPAPLPEEPPLS